MVNVSVSNKIIVGQNYLFCGNLSNSKGAKSDNITSKCQQSVKWIICIVCVLIKHCVKLCVFLMFTMQTSYNRHMYDTIDIYFPVSELLFVLVVSF